MCLAVIINVRIDVYTYRVGRTQKNGWNRSGETANHPYHRPASMELESTSNHSETQCGSPGIGCRSIIPIQEERKELGRIILYPWVTLSHKCLKTELWAQRERSKDPHVHTLGNSKKHQTGRHNIFRGPSADLNRPMQTLWVLLQSLGARMHFAYDSKGFLLLVSSTPFGSYIFCPLFHVILTGREQTGQGNSVGETEHSFLFFFNLLMWVGWDHTTST